MREDARRKDAFFDILDGQRLAVTFDDVRLRTDHSVTPPDRISIESWFTRRVPLKTPIVSAAMDTVTEHKMAIAMAKLGGLGVIHYNLTPEEQAEEAKRVWFHLMGRIDRPIFARAEETVESVLNRRAAKGWSFHTFPVLDGEGRLVGLLTRNDFDFCADPSQLAEKVMTPLADLIVAGPETTLDQAYGLMMRCKKKVIPLVTDGRLGGMYIFSDVQRIKTGSSAMFNLDANGHLRTAIAASVDDVFRRIELSGKYIAAVLLNTAHADYAAYLEVLRELKRMSLPFDIAAGNISEGWSATRLLDAGADGILVGQGGGSICTTRPVAGVGTPQVTAVHECEKAIRGSGVPICSDGGIRYSGDIPVAIGAGASSVMLGRAFAGTEEAPGEPIEHIALMQGPSGEMNHQRIRVKVYRGMGSLKAMQEREGSRKRYRQEDAVTKVPEGIEGAVPLQGPVANVVMQLLGGLRSGMNYVGAANIPELQEKADFKRNTDAGRAESHPHDVIMLDEPPNYRRGM